MGKIIDTFSFLPVSKLYIIVEKIKTSKKLAKNRG